MSFRQATDQEQGLLEKLLEPIFPGRSELLDQLKTVTVNTIDEDGSLELQCDVCHPAQVMCRIPTEGECKDSDGVVIHVLLHVVDGMMCELELFKEDGSLVSTFPNPHDLLLVTPFGEEDVNWRVHERWAELESATGSSSTEAGGPGLDSETEDTSTIRGLRL
jgi:hypothetical protein